MPECFENLTMSRKWQWIFNVNVRFLIFFEQNYEKKKHS